jgi:UDP-N-acetylmuramyl pentapeptide phosphotransferase/UDP-N-acetylglucosamine-1-phosphate transferase
MSSVFQLISLQVSHSRGIFIDDHESNLPQKFHETPTPRIGGVGIFASCLLFALYNRTGILLIICCLPAFLAGVFEDLYLNFSPNKRLLIMLASGILPTVLLNIVITNFGLFETNYPLGVFISFIAIIGLINGTNMIDGFNGLLGLTCIIIFGTFAFMAYHLNDEEIFLVCMVLIGSLIGFTFFNYPIGKIFMGDGGAYLLGFFLAVIAMLLVLKHPEINPFFVLTCIIYPVTEVIFSFIRKSFIHHMSPFLPDKYHLHMIINRQLVNGNNSRTVLVIAPVLLLFEILAVVFFENQWVLIMLNVVFIILYLSVFYSLNKKEKKYNT